MKKKMQVLFFLALSNVLWAALPMENIGRYNVVLVHGAADSLSGVDCEASDLKAPFEF